jgi:DNA modification methylase
MKSVLTKISAIKRNPNNPRILKDDKFVKLTQSIKDFPQMLDIRPIVVNDDMVVLGGNMRLKACKEAGLKEVPVIKVSDLTEEQQREFIIKDNVGFGEWDWDLLANDWDADLLEDWGLDLNLDAPDEEKYNDQERVELQDSFIAPPFSILDTKQKYWQDRKQQWKDLGIKSELGRDAGAFSTQGGLTKNTDVSIFDPVLTEICYKWFNVDKGSIYDCFAGGSVRGIVAEKLGFKYTGIDLRDEQIEANKNNANEIGVEPTWYCDDGLNVDKYVEDESVDMVFSCPPYADLEVYSDKENDLSNMDYADFKGVYSEIINKACKKLKQDRFAVFVISEVRNKKGSYYGFVNDTIKAFEDGGLNYYNEIVLANMIGTAPLRARNTFRNRKVVKIHQNVLVFYKGNLKNIKDNFNDIEIADLNYDEND